MAKKSKPRSKTPKQQAALNKIKELSHLVSVGDATLADFDLLGIDSVSDLALCDPKELYDRLCELKGIQLDPCCEDVFRAAVAQAQDPNLPMKKRKWAYWSQQRKGL